MNAAAFEPDRLRVGRELVGLSQSQLASKADLFSRGDQPVRKRSDQT